MSDEGAWFATAPDGAPVVLKLFPDETVAERYASLLPALDEPDHGVLGTGVRARPRRRRLDAVGAERSAGCVGAQPVTGNGGAGGRVRRRHGRCRLSSVAARPAPLVRPSCTRSPSAWTGGRCTSRCAPEADAARQCSTRRKAVGADADAAWFPTDGLVHLDLHTDNILAGDDGTLTGIIDWEGRAPAIPASISSGSRTTSTGTINRSGTSSRPPASSRACLAYVAHHALRCTSGRSTTASTTCRASSTAPSASSIGTRPRRPRPPAPTSGAPRLPGRRSHPLEQAWVLTSRPHP